MVAVQLRSIVQVKTGTKNPTTKPDEEFTYVDVAGVDNIAKVIVSPKVLLGAEAPSRARKVITTGDVLVSTIRPNLNAVALVPESLDGQVASTGFCVLRPTDKVLPQYLYYFVRSPAFVSSLCGLVAGAMYPAVTDGQVLDQLIPLPSLDEQRRIVDILSRAESIVRLRREAQQKAAELVPAIFLDMFGDPAANPKGWPIAPLGELLDSADYGTSCKSSDDSSGVPVIRMGNVSYAGDLNLADLKYLGREDAEVAKYGLQEGDILFNRTNSKDLVGKTGIWSGGHEGVAASYFIRLRVNRARLHPTYLWALMNSRHMKKVLFETARGAIGQANINSKELRSFRIAIPTLQLQEAYAVKVKSVQSICDQQADATSKAGMTFESLLCKTFII